MLCHVITQKVISAMGWNQLCKTTTKPNKGQRGIYSSYWVLTKCLQNLHIVQTNKKEHHPVIFCLPCFIKHRTKKGHCYLCLRSCEDCNINKKGMAWMVYCCLTQQQCTVVVILHCARRALAYGGRKPTQSHGTELSRRTSPRWWAARTPGHGSGGIGPRRHTASQASAAKNQQPH